MLSQAHASRASHARSLSLALAAIASPLPSSRKLSWLLEPCSLQPTCDLHVFNPRFPSSELKTFCRAALPFCRFWKSIPFLAHLYPLSVALHFNSAAISSLRPRLNNSRAA